MNWTRFRRFCSNHSPPGVGLSVASYEYSDVLRVAYTGRMANPPNSRPRKKAAGEMLRLRISAEVKTALIQQSERYGMNTSEYVRTLVVAELRRAESVPVT